MFPSKSTIRLLRIPFSVYLLPVFCFALIQAPEIDLHNTLWLFFILHLLVYPASNGYNSYMDRDTGSIGGLKTPPEADKDLFHTTLVMDIAATLLANLISPVISLMILVYIAVSRAYSYRGIRLKKYPLAGFLSVVIFQGAFTYLTVYLSAVNSFSISGISVPVVMAMLVTSCLLAASYPLTQVYQHVQDGEDGVRTISMMLGYRGTFLFSGIFFLISTGMLYAYFLYINKIYGFVLFVIFSAPVMLYFGSWFLKVYQNPRHADFENTMKMNRIAALSLIMCFMTILCIGKIRIFL
jgi:1,4-dihydroxy-2-naphthoate polyprenyltransferase